MILHLPGNAGTYCYWRKQY